MLSGAFAWPWLTLWLVASGSVKEKRKRSKGNDSGSPEEDTKRQHLNKSTQIKRKPKDDEDTLEIDEAASVKGEKTRKKMKNSSNSYKEEHEDLLVIDDHSPTEITKGINKHRSDDDLEEDDDEDGEDKKSRPKVP